MTTRAQAEKREERVMSLQIILSTMLGALFNPFMLAQLLAQSGGQCIAVIRWLWRKPPSTLHPIDCALPVNGTWEVINGGPDRKTSHSWSLLSQRFAYDLVIRDPNTGHSHTGSRAEPRAYFAFASPVYAPADGVVVQVRRDQRDARRAGTGWLDWLARDIRGNHIIIAHDGYFSMMAHLKQGSCNVQVGDVVRRGQLIGAVGHSGHSTEPHLHFQLQDRANFYTAVGLPVRFEVTIDRRGAPSDEPSPKSGLPRREDRLTATESGDRWPDASVTVPVGFREFASALITLVGVLAGVFTIYRNFIRLLVAVLRAFGLLEGQ
ncbi:M23 family metallopeptidase [Sorangium sp. So ce1024]|uniref:M23 family metallopeptidase n=1 Tax=Sorangium sp. So ce1024 TaxID=3133327 RepID=UPI003F08755C